MSLRLLERLNQGFCAPFQSQLRQEAGPDSDTRIRYSPAGSTGQRLRQRQGSCLWEFVVSSVRQASLTGDTTEQSRAPKHAAKRQ